MSARRIIATAVIAWLTAGPAGAEDIGVVTVRNNAQCQTIRNILGHACARVDNRFVVSISEGQTTLLAEAGIEFDVIFQAADPARTFLVYPAHGPDPLASAMTDAVPLGKGLKLSRSPDLMARAVESGEFSRVIPLQSLGARFSYVPETVAGMPGAALAYPTDTLADMVSLDSLYEYVTYLEGYETRYWRTREIDAARDWIFEKFTDWGYTDVSTQELFFEGTDNFYVPSHGPGLVYNVIAVKPGYAEPDRVIVIGGHYDSWASTAFMKHAPGADDNATGTATVLELARILADVPLRKTVMFMAFSAEEAWLVGSLYAAEELARQGTDVEVMFNYDMIGYDPNNYRRVDLFASPIIEYTEVNYDAARRLTSLNPVVETVIRASDHLSFYYQGWEFMWAHEGLFNDSAYHTALDRANLLNFAFFTDIVRMAAAAVGVVANSVDGSAVVDVVDRGDGQSLEITWSPCNPDYTYRIWYGTTSGYYSQSVTVPYGESSHTVSGLDEGVTYYFAAMGETAGAYPPVYSIEMSGVAYVNPRAPTGLTAEPGVYEIALDWEDNGEADFSHYRVYRDDGSGMTLIADNVSASSFLDVDLAAATVYSYQVTAVDHDLNESAPSNQVGTIVYTFDQGILLVDETADDWVLPDQQAQEAFFDSIFAGEPYGLAIVQGPSNILTCQQAGPYSSIFWVDDDAGYFDIGYNEDTLRRYTGFENNLMVAGWQTITRWSESPLDTDHFLYEQFGVTGYTQNELNDWCGASGQNGWPPLTTDTDNTWEGNLPFIPALEVIPGASVIYTYDSFSDDPTFEGQPCGVYYEHEGGKRVLLAFPLYHLTPASAEALIAKAIAVMEPTADQLCGDVDGSGRLDALDVTYLVEFVWNGGPPPVGAAAGDVDGSSHTDAVDLVYLVDYLFGTGPAPAAGRAR
ncbi:MAG: M28 family peptidase [Candidatus Zixiibacteriota bacterium]|nr:MAG: M28 family peptidase [candidate division Zixibacteria bacterium]